MRQVATCQRRPIAASARTKLAQAVRIGAVHSRRQQQRRNAAGCWTQRHAACGSAPAACGCVGEGERQRAAAVGGMACDGFAAHNPHSYCVPHAETSGPGSQEAARARWLPRRAPPAALQASTSLPAALVVQQGSRSCAQSRAPPRRRPTAGRAARRCCRR